MSTPEPTSSPPSLVPVLRYYGPWVCALAVLGAALAAYLDLRARVQVLEAGEGASATLQPPESNTPLADVRPPASGGEPGPAPAVVTQGPAPAWACPAHLPEEAVRASIGRHGPAVIRCYEERAAEAPELRGTLLVRLRVSASGAVDGVYVAGIEDPPLVSCVGNAAVGWRFPAPVGGGCAVVEAPFALGPR